MCTFFLASCAMKQNGLAVRDKLSDEEILDSVQYHTFQYFWDGAEPVSGAGRERFHEDGLYPQNDKNTVATGAAGFGIMAIITAIDRKFVPRNEGVQRLNKILGYLEKADRFHGAWPHWMEGETGRVKPFSKRDDGGDLVETSFVAQGLICIRQYFKAGNFQEQALAAKATQLWEEIDFNFYRNGKNVLYWHWSPQYQWQMNFAVRGYNECLIMYVLAASSPKYGVPAEVYHEGWAQNGKIKRVTNYKGIPLQLFHQGDAKNGGPLFWAHYSFLGLNPNGLSDRYADYGQEVRNMAKINYQWSVDNPGGFEGYSPESWGLTASYSVTGYAAHAPSLKEDLGVISPTAALSSFPYTPKESMAAMRNWYTNKKDKIWGKYGFYDAFSDQAAWYPKKYLGIDQGPIVVMIENYRSGLLWELFMKDKDVQSGLKKLDFVSPYLK
ncbi:hypothetical protein SAMN05661099_2886 [Daejeonella lutea]|uniref:Glycoamylase-like domain-containing protein n=2 Tax=Daejeonella lutea TaxID=572036 RepID=A0A1T5ED37_9SPHI|nr:hypothetical protein SAMN05661099_2886 [Daejeonella lutea]